MAASLASGDRSIALGEIADRFGMAGAGALLLLLAIPAFIPVPLPTGIPAGVAAAAIGAQIALGHERPWLPGWARRFSLRRDQVAAGLGRLFRLLRRLGLRLRRRLPQAVGTHGAPRPLAGLVLVVCGIVLILPIPFGNQLPSLAIAAIGLGLLRGDGVFVLVGYGFAAATLAWTATLVFAGAGIMQALAGLLPAF